MENYTVINSGINGSVVENFDPKKLKVRPEDYGKIKKVDIDVVKDVPEIVEFNNSENFDSYEAPIEDVPLYTEAEESFKEDTSNMSATSENVDSYDDIYRPSIPWVDKREQDDYKIPVVPFSTPSLSNVVAMNNNNAEAFTSNSVDYYRTLLDKEELSPTARKYLEAKIIEIDALDDEIKDLQDKMEKAKEILKQLDDQKSNRKIALDKMEDMLNATSKIDLSEIRRAANDAGISIGPDLEEFKAVVSKLEARSKETAGSIQSIESAKDRENKVLTELNAEVDKRNGQIKDITNNLPAKLKDASDVDEAEKEAQAEATAAQERLESLRNKKAELLKTLSAEAPKKVTGIRNAFLDVREEEKGTARAA